MKTAHIAAAALISLAAVPVFARSSGTGWPVCFQAAQTAVRAIDARNHGYTRADARRGEAIPSNMQFGNTPQWVVEMIDPYLNAAYAVPASQKVDADSEGAKVFNECKARVAQGA